MTCSASDNGTSTWSWGGTAELKKQSMIAVALLSRIDSIVWAWNIPCSRVTQNLMLKRGIDSFFTLYFWTSCQKSMSTFGNLIPRGDISCIDFIWRYRRYASLEFLVRRNLRKRIAWWELMKVCSDCTVRHIHAKFNDILHTYYILLCLCRTAWFAEHRFLVTL